MATFAEEPDAIFEPCGFAEIFIFAKRLCFMYYSLRFQLVALDSQALVFNFMLLWLVMMSLAQETGFRSNSSFHSWRKKKTLLVHFQKELKLKEEDERMWEERNDPIPQSQLVTASPMGVAIQMFTPPDVQTLASSGQTHLCRETLIYLRSGSLPSSHTVKPTAVSPSAAGCSAGDCQACRSSRHRGSRRGRRVHLSKEMSVIHAKWPVRAPPRWLAETRNGKHVQRAQGPHRPCSFPGNGVMKDGANTWTQAAHRLGCFTMRKASVGWKSWARGLEFIETDWLPVSCRDSIPAARGIEFSIKQEGIHLHSVVLI